MRLFSCLVSGPILFGRAYLPLTIRTTIGQDGLLKIQGHERKAYLLLGALNVMSHA